MVVENVTKLANIGKGTGYISGKIGSWVGKVTSDFSLFIANMKLYEWILLIIIILGSIFVWYLKNRYNLKFTFLPKKPKKTFN